MYTKKWKKRIKQINLPSPGPVALYHKIRLRITESGGGAIKINAHTKTSISILLKHLTQKFTYYMHSDLCTVQLIYLRSDSSQRYISALRYTNVNSIVLKYIFASATINSYPPFPPNPYPWWLYPPALGPNNWYKKAQSRG